MAPRGLLLFRRAVRGPQPTRGKEIVPILSTQHSLRCEHSFPLSLLTGTQQHEYRNTYQKEVDPDVALNHKSF